MFRRLGELDVPSFAFVNGAALGGGLELALHCTYRTISSGVTAVAFPECFLGLLPGWGGTYLLPRLIGPAKALKVIIENPLSQNRCCAGPQAFELGIADAMFEPADFLAESLRWAGGSLGRRRPDPRRTEHPAPEPDPGGLGRRPRPEHGSSPTASCTAPLPPRTGPSTWSRRPGTGPATRGSAPRTRRSRTCCSATSCRPALYAFDLTQKRARHAAGAPGHVAGPAGHQGRRRRAPGLMAAQIALLFARRLEVPVVLTDLDAVPAGRRGRPRARRDRQAGRAGTGSAADTAARLTGLVTGSLTKDAFADADFVIEAVFEEMSVKQQVFAEVEAVVRPDCVLATNTSSLSVTEMAAGLAHPSRLVGFHFFNPVAMMPLVEVVRVGQQGPPPPTTRRWPPRSRSARR